MGRSLLYFLPYYLVSLMYACLVNTDNLVLSVVAIESPQYTLVRSESDLEIRLYGESSWMSALVPGATTFEKSTKDGFHRLYQYIHGGNLDHSRITITAPVLTSINSSSSLGSNYSVSFYLPAKYLGSLPQPNPELNLQLNKWRSHCIAVRKFSGFAKDENINKEIDALITSLNKQVTGTAAILQDRNYYSIAQYNASNQLSGRLNEVWIDVTDFTVEGCPGYQGKY